MEHLNGKPRFPFVLFDLGSTLIRFDGSWDVVIPEALKAATHRLLELGHRVDSAVFPGDFYALMRRYSDQRDESFMEYTAQFVLDEALRAHGLESVSEAHQLDVLRAFYRVTQAHWHLEADAVPMLEALLARGCRLGIVSNASDDEDVQTLIDNAGIRPYFDVIVTSAKAGVRKPNPRIFQMALARWDARPQQAVMVGDLVLADVVGANALGIASVWIPRRADTPENRAAAEENQPGAVIQSLAELPLVLERWA
jgi:HAD superfamily hydrolase (TIGR01662 family)